MGRGDTGLGHGTLDVAGVRRGSGTSGKNMATAFTGLAARGPAAGVSVVFPDGWNGVWHIARPPAGEPGLDLVAGTLREFSREAQPVPRQRCPVTIMAGSPAPSPGTWTRPAFCWRWFLRQVYQRDGAAAPG